MSAIKGKGPLIDPGLCRCCGSIKKCRILNNEYKYKGQNEVYCDMFVDCFGLLLSHLNTVVTERLICATCVVRLREALSFRRQVLQCEEAFLQMKIYDKVDEHEPPVAFVSYEVKVEPLDDDAAFGDSLEQNNSGSEADASTDKPGATIENSSSNDDLPIARRKDFKNKIKTKSKKISTKSTTKKDSRQKPNLNVSNKYKLKRRLHPLVESKLLQRAATSNPVRRFVPMSVSRTKILERRDEEDPYYLTELNMFTVIECSYVCPFKCRHNNLYCYYCKENYTDPALLREHVSREHNPKKFRSFGHRTMTKVDITRIDCRLCPERIYDLDTFKDHITSVHGKTYHKDVPELILPFRLTKNQLFCTMCSKIFPYFHALNQHMNEHFNNFVCETCGLGFLDNCRLIMHRSKHSKSAFPCETCGKTFKTEAYKDLHVDRIHNKIGRIYCPKCDIRLMTYPQKLKHLVEVHGEQPLSFPCNACEKVFNSRRTLTMHLRRDHLKDFRHECHYCGQKFFTRFSMRNHMPMHTGERNFRCKVCEKSYPRSRTLKDHMRIHNNDRRYKCQICGQAFIQNCSLKGHMKSQHPEYTL